MSFRVKTHDDTVFDDEAIPEINIIPLVDVMLVLLIIFMVTAPLSIGGINVILPNSQAKNTSISPKQLVLSIDQNGDYFIEKAKIPEAELSGKLKALYEVRQDKNIYIRADHRVHYGKVVDAMSAASLAGVSKISMLTQLKSTP